MSRNNIGYVNAGAGLSNWSTRWLQNDPTMKSNVASLVVAELYCWRYAGCNHHEPGESLCLGTAWISVRRRPNRLGVGKPTRWWLYLGELLLNSDTLRTVKNGGATVCSMRFACRATSSQQSVQSAAATERVSGTRYRGGVSGAHQTRRQSEMPDTVSSF
jgi:hypothetical protein